MPEEADVEQIRIYPWPEAKQPELAKTWWLGDTRITILDLLLMSIKMTVCLVFVVFSTPVIGLLISFAMERAVYWLIAKVKGLEQLGTMDKNVYYDQVNNRCYIMAAMKIKKMER